MAFLSNSVAQSTVPTAVRDTVGYPVLTYQGDTGLFVPRADARKMLNDYTFLDLLLQQRALDRARISFLERDRNRADSVAVSFQRDYVREKDNSATQANSASILTAELKAERKQSKRDRIRSTLINCIVIPSSVAVGFGLGWLSKK